MSLGAVGDRSPRFTVAISLPSTILRDVQRTGRDLRDLRRWPLSLESTWPVATRHAASVLRSVAATTATLDSWTRRALSDALDLSPSTISKAVAELKERGLLAEGDTESDGPGRPVVPLRLATHHWSIVGINVVSENGEPSLLFGVLTDLEGTVLAEPVVSGLLPQNDERAWRRELAGQLASVTRELVAASAAAGRELLGVGVELGGHIDAGRVVFSINNTFGGDKSLEEFDLQAALELSTRNSVVVTNDVHSLAIRDALYGFTTATHPVTVALFDDGIGAAVMDGGRIYEGARGAAGEVGHLPTTLELGESYHACRCDPSPKDDSRKRPHVEAYVTPQRMLEWSGKGSWEELVTSSSDKAITTFRRAGRHLGGALATLATVLNPDQFVLYLPSELGGQVDQIGPRAHREALIHAVRNESFSDTGDVDGRISIDYRAFDADHGRLLGARSAAATVLDAFVRQLEQD